MPAPKATTAGWASPWRRDYRNQWPQNTSSTKPFLTTKFCPRRMATFGDAIWCKARAITRAWTITICSMMRMLSTASADAFSLRLRHCEEEGPPAALFQTASRPHYRGRLRAAVGCTGSAPLEHPKPCQLWVISGKTRNEHNMSGLSQKADLPMSARFMSKRPS